jgi:hypothetical protein
MSLCVNKQVCASAMSTSINIDRDAVHSMSLILSVMRTLISILGRRHHHTRDGHHTWSNNPHKRSSLHTSGPPTMTTMLRHVRGGSCQLFALTSAPQGD